MSSHNCTAAGTLSVSRIFSNTFAQAKVVWPRVNLVDRSKCPALLTLTGLTGDPNLQHYIRAQVRQLKRDFPDESIFSGSVHAQDCCCSTAGSGHWRLAQRIKSNRTGWQDDLVQELVPYVLSHMSAGVLNNIHDALMIDQPLNWKDFPPCNVRQNRNNPSAVLEAAGKAIQARIMLQKDAIHRCVILGAFLNIVKTHWLGCEWFRKGYTGFFPEHEYMRHKLFEEALNNYNEQPTQETFQLSADALRWSLAALPCPLASEHPARHELQWAPAAEHTEDETASEASQVRNADENEGGVCDYPGCITQASSSTGEDAGCQPR